MSRIFDKRLIAPHKLKYNLELRHHLIVPDPDVDLVIIVNGERRSRLQH